MDTLKMFKTEIISLFIISPYLGVLILSLFAPNQILQMREEVLGFSIMIPILLGLIWHVNKMTHINKNTALNPIYRLTLISIIGFFSVGVALGLLVVFSMASFTLFVIYLVITPLSFFGFLKLFIDTFFLKIDTK